MQVAGSRAPAGVGVVAAGAVAAGLAAAALGGCGDDLPSDLVARVGDAPIERSELERALRRTNRAYRYEPPDFDACVEAKAPQQAPDGVRARSDSELREECEREYERRRTAVMESLIADEWIRQQTSAMGIELSRAEVARELREYLGRSGASERSAYRAFLADSGRTRADVLADIRVDMLEQELFGRVARRAPAVTEEDVARHYRLNRGRYTRPERRDLRVVMARTREAASGARAALERGASWAEVARERSVDARTRARGGRMPDVPAGRLEDGLDEAVRSASPGELRGPVETHLGWYVFEVVRVEEEEQKPLRDAEPEIRRRLRERRERRALAAFNERFRARYAARTVCADGFEVAECGREP